MSREPFAPEVISASAGSGKTHQLTNRYLALLAAGVEPDAILATTFTRKAAGEILDRALERLAQAAGSVAAAKELAEQMGAEGAAPATFAALLRRLLRRLHRARISTLDSYYVALAGSFSFELGLPAGWSICEEADDEALRRDALEHLLDRQPEDIGRLLPLLSKGETKRSVHGQLLEVVGAHLDCHRGSERSAWECLHVPAPVAAMERAEALERLRFFDFSACRDKRFGEARDKDIGHFEANHWQAFLGTGLAAKVRAGETAYYKKPIPDEARSMYATLVRHATREILWSLREQTRATWDLLQRFWQELWALKQTAAGLRFEEVTQALVDGTRAKSLRAETVAFRQDGAIEHLLLDEFQDTSLPQWLVLQPLAESLVQDESRRSFFCVGDVKQAIYGWRGGMAEIFNTLENALGPLPKRTLSESRRSAVPVIEEVNQVFGNLSRFQPNDKCRAGLDAWGSRFARHTTVKDKEPGYVRLHTGPAQPDEGGVKEQRIAHCKFVAGEIQRLVESARGRTIGVLCRTKNTVARMIYELRRLRVEASEEAGNPLIDSPAVEVILSLFALADHPGHSVAWFHLKHSPLQDALRPFADADSLARHMRRELLTEGYGRVTQFWAKQLIPACDRRDLSRLDQLVEMAYAYQPRSTLRAGEFVAYVQQQRVVDPSGANVRVMTIHAAKGLEFDAVILPELDAGLLGQPPPFVAGRDANSLRVNFVCRYVDESVQALLTDGERRAFEQDRQRCVEESLSLLYVAMTRAVHALYLYIPGPRKGNSNRKDAWYRLLRDTLAPNEEWEELALLHQCGDPNWTGAPRAEPATSPEVHGPARISFRAMGATRRRGLEHVAPSRREGGARVALDRLFHPSEGTGMAAGTLYHAWFESIDWLDAGVPTEESLRATAEKLRGDLPAETISNLDRLLTTFRGWLENPAISGVLRRSAYKDARQPGFPAALASVWKQTIVPMKVERERRFSVLDGDKIWDGSLDRIVWLGERERIVAADVIDFKTDAIEPGDAKALNERTEHYRPQVEAYRRAVARMARLPEERVAGRLVFTFAGKIVEV